MKEEAHAMISGLYSQSSKLRGLARLFNGSPETETDRPDLTFSADEANGVANILKGIADEIDQARDRIFETPE